MTNRSWQTEWPFDEENSRYFSLARHALIEALRLADVGRGDHVLLPEFLCREVLASITTLGATVQWYAVGPNLSPLLPPTSWPKAKVVLAINYFGFPQNLTPFEDYSSLCGAVIIEDNAHGFLSRDASGEWLGCRARLGLFSQRKTIRMPDGAALFINDPYFQKKLQPQLPFIGLGFNRAEIIKAKLNQLPVLGRSLANFATDLVRSMRLAFYGHRVKMIDDISERELPYDRVPWSGLKDALIQLNMDMEAKRRRNAYLKIAQFAANINVEPLFSELPSLCVPYGFPLRGNAVALKKISKYAESLGFGIMSWPDLPTNFQASAPEYYKDVKLVNFLW